HAGRFPFLQTASTVEGLEQLARYELMDRKEARFLKESYWFLRSLEHRIQIREEQQTHTLPTDPVQLALLAESFGFSEPSALRSHLDEIREEVRLHYDELLKGSSADEDFNDWWKFFSEGEATPRIEAALEGWFGKSDETHRLVGEFVQGSQKSILTREQISQFIGVTKCFDRLMPRLAFPLRALRRISRFAQFYGTRHQFLSTCSLDPGFFEVLALLFDRSSFIYELLCLHPEILEEVLRPEIVRRRKTVSETLEEMMAGVPDTEGEGWLWLYVKAEQIRIAIGDLLEYLDLEETEQSLTVLADAVLTFLMKRFDADSKLAVVALGKYGGSEMTFGSDLDLLFLAEPGASGEAEKAIQLLVQRLSRNRGAGKIYELDLRLRPHGNAGPLASTLSALERYYRNQAQPWEKQMLARSRVVVGVRELARGFDAFREELLYSDAADPEELRDLWRMRLRIERERDRTNPPQRAFKTGPGGIVDVEFFGQFLQLLHGHRYRELRHPNTRHLLRLAGELGLIGEEEAGQLLRNYGFLKRVEVLLRRDRNAAVSVIKDSPEELFSLARWSGYETVEDFWSEHCRAMNRNREIIENYLRTRFQIDLETLS
ncbi:MAG TPA: hypothetical protein VK041_08465, partial [Opitutales bacterium]|nr:hypothetical protein [Opitutales bacterium]